MADQATLAIVIQDQGGGAAPSSPGLRYNPDLDEAMGFGRPAGERPPVSEGERPRRGARGEPAFDPVAEARRVMELEKRREAVKEAVQLLRAKQVEYTPGMEGPRQADVIKKIIGESPTDTKGLFSSFGAQLVNLSGPLGKLSPALGKAATSASTFAATLAPVAAPVALAAGAVAFGIKEYVRLQDANINAQRNQLQTLYARNQFEQRLAELNKPSSWHTVPIIGGIFGGISDTFRDIKNYFTREPQKVTFAQEKQQEFQRDIARLAPFSGPVSVGQIRGEAYRIQAAVREGAIVGDLLGRIEAANARVEANRDILNAQSKRQQLAQQANDTEVRAALSDIAVATKDANKKADIQQALEETIAGDMKKARELLEKLRGEAEELRRSREEELRRNPLQWAGDMFRGFMEMPVPGIDDARDPVLNGDAANAQIQPAF